jgi:hypothetical protein
MKQWLQTETQSVLIEGIRWIDIAAKLEVLNAANPSGASATLKDRFSWLIDLATPAQPPLKAAAVMVEGSGYNPIGLVWDYIAVPSSWNTDYTFSSGQTYYVSSTTYFSANVTFNPGCFLKFNGGYLLIYGSIVCNGTSGNPSVLTAWDDDLFGEAHIQTETGCPTYSAAPALWDYFINADVSVSGMRFRWARTAIQLDANWCKTHTHTVSGCTFEMCQVCICGNNCNVSISSSTRCGVGTPTAGGCVSFAGSLVDVCNGDSDQSGYQDLTEFQFFGRLGTLPGNVVGGVFSRTRGRSPSTDEVIWSTRDDANMIYRYNTNCWLYGVAGLTAFSPWHAKVDVKETYQGGGTLITPRHAIVASHFAIPDNTPVRFVGSDNIAHQVICLHGEQPPDIPDYWVMVLDQDLPSTVARARILPSDVIHKLTPTMEEWADPCYFSATLPAVAFNQRKEAYVCDAKYFFAFAWSAPLVTFGPSQWFSYWGSYCHRFNNCSCLSTDVTSGDSGSPTFLLISGELALIGPWSGCDFAVWSGQYFTELNTAINELDTWVSNTYGTNAMTGYTATSFPLESFPALF